MSKVRPLGQQISMLGRMRAGSSPELTGHISFQEWVTETRREGQLCFLRVKNWYWRHHLIIQQSSEVVSVMLTIRHKWQTQGGLTYSLVKNHAQRFLSQKDETSWLLGSPWRVVLEWQQQTIRGASNVLSNKQCHTQRDMTGIWIWLMPKPIILFYTLTGVGDHLVPFFSSSYTPPCIFRWDNWGPQRLHMLSEVI